jgi:hypothetical protein
MSIRSIARFAFHDNRALVRGVIIAAAFAALAQFWPARAEEAKPSMCADAGALRAGFAGRGSWIELAPAQWQFLRGIYILNPATAPGLPYGDRAALVRVQGKPGGLIMFLDGPLACTPMEIPDVVIEMVMAVGRGEIGHESAGQGL